MFNLREISLFNIKLFVFIVGSFVGSFLNVCISRLPEGKSIVSPRSHCPNCQKTILWYDNVPFLSYFILLGRCRYCGKKISPRYFFVELLSASIFLFFYMRYGVTTKFFIYTILFSSLLVAGFIDLKYQIIPDVISVSGIVLGIFFSLLFPEIHKEVSVLPALKKSFLGLIVGGGMIWLIGFLGKLVFKKEAMGFGDVKLMAMLGAFLGAEKIVLTFFIAPFFGLIFGIISLMKTKSHYIPYGPFLILGGFITLVWGENIWLLITGYWLLGK
ncbi:MAG: prepilin peptidase [Candidatus Omnitrophica bacterium]|nr:prepilin peptidase [Candidatus Omnitrophota bacterium]